MLQPASFRPAEEAYQDIRYDQVQYGGNTEGGKGLIGRRVNITGDFQQIRDRRGEGQRRGVQHQNDFVAVRG